MSDSVPSLLGTWKPDLLERSVAVKRRRWPGALPGACPRVQLLWRLRLWAVCLGAPFHTELSFLILMSIFCIAGYLCFKFMVLDFFALWDLTAKIEISLIFSVCSQLCHSDLFETGSCYIALELTTQTRLALNSQKCACTCLPSSGIKVVCHHTQLVLTYCYYFLLTFFLKKNLLGVTQSNEI